MSEAKHTPGPWRACEPASNFQKGQYLIRPANGETLIAKVGSELRFVERHANARLIAAAPLMYTFIKCLADRGDEHAAQIIAAI